MKIVVIGGSGLIGSKLVSKLRQLEHEVIAASPSSGINALTGQGLQEAISGADVVVDVSNSPSFEDKPVLAFFETSTRNLIEAEKAAGVKHYVALSVVGTSLMQERGYFRAKQAQENLIKASGIPFTIVQSTQFFEFLSTIAASGGTGEIIRLSTAFMQPIAAEDVAAILVDAALGKPINGIIEIAGPDKWRISDIVQQYLAKNNDSRKVIPDAGAGYFGAEVTDTTLVPAGKAHLGSINFEAWFNNQSQKN